MLKYIFFKGKLITKLLIKIKQKTDNLKKKIEINYIKQI